MPLSRYTLALIGIAAATIGAFAWREKDRSAEREAADRERIEFDNSVTELPPGIREKWMVDLDRRIDEIFTVDESRIVVHGDTVFLTSSISDYPAAMASYHCDSRLGVGVKFGAGPEADWIPVFWLLGSDYQFGEGVGNDSPAAQNLMRDMCARLRQRLSG